MHGQGPPCSSPTTNATPRGSLEATTLDKMTQVFAHVSTMPLLSWDETLNIGEPSRPLVRLPSKIHIADHAVSRGYRRDRDACRDGRCIRCWSDMLCNTEPIKPLTAFTHLTVKFTPLHTSPFLFRSLRTSNEPLNHLFELTPHLIHALPLCLYIPPILDFDRGTGRLRYLL